MELILKDQHKEIMQVNLGVIFLEWLRLNTHGIIPELIDPYCDRTLHNYAQHDILKRVKHLVSENYKELEDQCLAKGKLPSDQALRIQILDSLFCREKAENVNWIYLGEFQSILEIAIEDGLTVYCIGD
jgi:hypothetical protein